MSDGFFILIVNLMRVCVSLQIFYQRHFLFFAFKHSRFNIGLVLLQDASANEGNAIKVLGLNQPGKNRF